MMPPKTTARLLAFFLPIIALGIIAGCKCYRKETVLNPVTTIFVDRPEVFTRERLLSSRFQEKQWLEKKLQETPKFEFQGLRDVREFKGFYNQLTAQIAPLEGKVDALKLKSEADQLEAQRELTKLQNEIELTRTRQQLQQLREDIAAGKRVTSAAAKSETGQSGEEAEASTAEVEEAEKVSPASFLAGQKYPELPKPEDVTPTKAMPTPIERLRDEMAYRNAVQAALREQELDDTHDLFGRTIYTLKFDVTVAPDRETDALARVDVRIEPPDYLKLSFDKDAAVKPGGKDKCKPADKALDDKRTKEPEEKRTNELEVVYNGSSPW